MEQLNIDRRASRIPAAKLLSTLFVLLVALPFRIRHAFLLFNSVSIFDIALLGFGFGLLLTVLHRDGRLFVGSKSVLSLLSVPLIVGMLSLGWTSDLSTTIYYLVALTEAILSYLVVVNLLRSIGASGIMRLLALMVLFIIGISLLSYFRIPGFAPHISYELGWEREAFLASYYARLSSPFIGKSNSLATPLVFFFFLSWLWHTVSRRWAYMGLTSAILAAIVMTASKGSAVAIILTVPLFVRWVRVKIRRLILPILGVTMLVLVAFSIAALRSEEFRTHSAHVFSVTSALNSGAERFQRFRLAWALSRQAPLLGYGAGVIPREDESFDGNVHNTYIENLLYFGFPLGLLANFALLGLPFVFMRGQTNGGMVAGVSLGIAAAIISQLVAFTLESSYEGQFVRILFYISIGFSVALVNSLTRCHRETVGGTLDTSS